jgi:hypothetical protein
MQSAVFQVVIGILVTLISGFCAWITLKAVELDRKIAELEVRVRAREEICATHHAWMTDLSAKIGKIAEDVAFVRGSIGKKQQ